MLWIIFGKLQLCVSHSVFVMDATLDIVINTICLQVFLKTPPEMKNGEIYPR